MTTESITVSYAIFTRIKNNGVALLKDALLAIIVFSIFLIIIKKIVTKIKERIQENSLQEDIYSKKVADLTGNVIYVVLMIFNILAVFQVIGFDTTLIIGGISISIGFAMETTIGNMIAGIMIMTNKKVKLGDFVQFLGKLRIMGTIEEITIRYTVIRTFDKRRTIIPNTILASTPIKTLKSEPIIRGDVQLRLPRHVDINQIKSLLINTINNIKGVLYPEYTNIIVTGFDTKGIGIKGYFFVNPQGNRGKIAIKKDFMIRIREEFKKYGITIPYEHITLTLDTQP